MANVVKYTSIFEKYFKRYSKKYRSLPEDIEALSKILIQNPTIGTNLGNNIYKIRLSSKSKNKGKSGGFRVITYLVTQKNDNYEVNLIIIYDKSDIKDIPKQKLLKIVNDILG